MLVPLFIPKWPDSLKGLFRLQRIFWGLVLYDQIWMSMGYEYVPSMEFAYNNMYHGSIQMTLFEVLYGRRCKSPLGKFVTSDH